jgi:hypothetical protein
MPLLTLQLAQLLPLLPLLPLLSLLSLLPLLRWGGALAKGCSSDHIPGPAHRRP